MSEAIAFDTHRYVKRLMEGGFDERQAETLAEEQIAFLNANLATKSDIAKIKAGIEALRQDIQAGIEGFKQETRAGIETLRQEIRVGIEGFRQETKAEHEGLRSETKLAIEEAKVNLIKWMLGAMLAQTTVILAFIALFLTPPA